jgi:hypothetical protein
MPQGFSLPLSPLGKADLINGTANVRTVMDLAKGVPVLWSAS